MIRHITRQFLRVNRSSLLPRMITNQSSVVEEVQEDVNEVRLVGHISRVDQTKLIPRKEKMFRGFTLKTFDSGGSTYFQLHQVIAEVESETSSLGLSLGDKVEVKGMITHPFNKATQRSFTVIESDSLRVLQKAEEKPGDGEISE